MPQLCLLFLLAVVGSKPAYDIPQDRFHQRDAKDHPPVPYVAAKRYRVDVDGKTGRFVLTPDPNGGWVGK